MAFKPHSFEIDGNKVISISARKKEVAPDMGTKIKELRTRIGISQKELADKVDLTPSFISQLENNQISPSLNSFIQICNALGVAPAAILGEKSAEDAEWLIRKEMVLSTPVTNRDDLKEFMIVKNGNMLGRLIFIEPYSDIRGQMIPEEGQKLIYVLRGNLTVIINDRQKTLGAGDSIYLKDEIPSLWKNQGGDKAELLLLCT
ncbi:MAG: XRE family transcriptional regulator [Nitrospirota bacterium]